MEPTPTADLDRNNDRVYDSTICVVRAITELTHGVQGAGKLDYLDLVRRVGLELRVLLGSVDDLVAFFPDVAKHEVNPISRLFLSFLRYKHKLSFLTNFILYCGKF